MKLAITLFFIILFWSPVLLKAQENIPYFDGKERQLRQVAKSEGKPFFIYISSKNCHGCRTLEKVVLADPRVEDFVKENSLAFREIIQESRSVANAYQVRGTPTVIFFNARGEEVSRKAGNITSDEFINMLQQAGK